ncbi:GNAT family N-acetyltransferase [Roseateles amylovorans]|uniref:GNAT family N-acetyltransferase n=1 Tax=Roseateles amylovorans TaxID=2978473 RepID=A0ABY6B4Z0_9BURK|nr:GNAT family N-acetyltransferase [Roseateles amylovorans]UXH78618.1 GNAT family N-acetyltransferase [Roseateles amylovorans]
MTSGKTPDRPTGALSATLRLTPVSPDDAEALIVLRIAAMKPSLERLGRFDPQRARERFLASFDPALTRHIEVDRQRLGFVVIRPQPDWLLLDHLYLHPDAQGRGLGAAVLQRVFAQAEALGLPVRVGALRGSDANRFYQRHGFLWVEESEFDLYYLRPRSTVLANPPAEA